MNGRSPSSLAVADGRTAARALSADDVRGSRHSAAPIASSHCLHASESAPSRAESVPQGPVTSVVVSAIYLQG